MERIGLYGLYAGLVITLLGLILGFGFMFAGQDDMAMTFLMAVPVGFLMTFAGLSTVVLFSPRDNSK